MVDRREHGRSATPYLSRRTIVARYELERRRIAVTLLPGFGVAPLNVPRFLEHGERLPTVQLRLGRSRAVSAVMRFGCGYAALVDRSSVVRRACPCHVIVSRIWACLRLLDVPRMYDERRRRLIR